MASIKLEEWYELQYAEPCEFSDMHFPTEQEAIDFAIRLYETDLGYIPSYVTRHEIYEQITRKDLSSLNPAQKGERPDPASVLARVRMMMVQRQGVSTIPMTSEQFLEAAVEATLEVTDS